MNEGDKAGSAPLYRYRFGSAEFDEARFELRVGGLAVELERKPLEVLLAFLRHAGEVVTKEELFESIWAGRITVENVLANAIAKLRKALGEAQGQCIVTVPRIGYRLDGTIERMAVGRSVRSTLALAPGQPVPQRAHFMLDLLLARTLGAEVWRARHPKTGELRVYKFSLDGERLSALKREATLARVLRQSLSERSDFVRVIDWNFESAPFFLECEYGGDSLAEWAGAGHLATASQNDRIALFLDIADAVAAAHSVGVLHKDLKPANVLIASADGARRQVRLTDFGSGRLLEPERLQELGITQLGMTLTQNPSSDSSSGTPLYLAPELLAGRSPTVQSDLYALGVMLYQLLVGDLRRPMTSGWERDIDDALLRADIAAATDGDPARRLASVAELGERLRTRAARALERQRQHDAEQRAASAERALDRTRARRPWIVAAVAVLVLGLSLSLWFYRQADIAAEQLAREVRVSRAVNDFVAQDLIGAANPSVSGRSGVTVVEAAKAALPHIDDAFAEAPDIQAALHQAMQQALAGLANYEGAVAEGRKAVAAFQKAQPLDALGLNEARILMAYSLSHLGQYPEGKALLDDSAADVARLAAAHPQTQIRYWEALGQLADDQFDPATTLALDRKSWALMQTLADAAPDFRERIEFNLADTLRMDGRFDESEPLVRDVIARQSARLGAQHWKTQFTTALLAVVLVGQHRLADASALLPPVIEALDAALGPNDRRTLLARSVLADVYFNQADFAAAAQLFSTVYQGFAKTSGENSSPAIGMLADLAGATAYSGDAKAAELLFRRGLATARATLGEDNPRVQSLRYGLADCLLDLKRPTEAAKLLDGLSVEQLNVSARNPAWDALLSYDNGRLALQRGDAAAALPLLEKGIAGVRENSPLWLPMLRQRHGDLIAQAQTLLVRNRPAATFASARAPG